MTDDEVAAAALAAVDGRLQSFLELLSAPVDDERIGRFVRATQSTLDAVSPSLAKDFAVFAAKTQARAGILHTTRGLAEATAHQLGEYKAFLEGLRRDLATRPNDVLLLPTPLATSVSLPRGRSRIDSPSADFEVECMRLAVEEARKSKTETDSAKPKPMVGAVVAKDGKVLEVAHRGELSPGEHAEYTLLERKLSTATLSGSTVYTTLEPCTTRGHPKVPCATRLSERQVTRVVIGMLDPNDDIRGRGQIFLRERGIDTQLFPIALAREIEELNRDFSRNIVLVKQDEAQSAERKRFLRTFNGHSLSCEIDGKAIHVAWAGELGALEEREPTQMTPSLVQALFEAVCRFRIERLQPTLRSKYLLGERIVYETDEGRNWKRKLESSLPTDHGSVLRVIVRLSTCLSFCPRCGLTNSGGNNCVHCPELGLPVPFKHVR
jgi:pyrimidine deaminase RibD-like protein